MQCTKIDKQTQNLLKKLFESYPLVLTIVEQLHALSARIFLVGGAVRDLLMQQNVHDIDIEVHNLSLEQLQTLLARHGAVDLVGKSFGVLRLHTLSIDWSVPRKDSKGRKPTVELDNTLSIKQAFERRDLTINAMGIDVITYELIDPFNGLADIKNKILRSPNINFFVQDPLRFYRVMHFIGRFEMQPNKELNECCTTMDITLISKERIATEFEKLLLLSKRPSLGLRWLATIDRLKEILPQLEATRYVKQEPEWHPEGNVFEHSMQTLDAAARIDRHNKYQNLVLRYAALCHDLGKATTTTVVDGRIRSFGHEHASARLAKQMLKKIVVIKDLIVDIVLLVKHHMAPLTLVKQNAGLAAYKRLALALAPRMTLEILAELSFSDHSGRNKNSHEPLVLDKKVVAPFLAKANQAKVTYQPEKPLLLGRDLLEYVSPGKELGLLLQWAYRLQIDKNITDKEILRQTAINKIKNT